MTSDFFTVPGISKIKAIRQASFHDAIKLLSIENSI